MDIPKNPVYSLNTLDRPVGRARPATPRAAAPEKPARARVNDRRRQPDRRRNQVAFKGQDRRRRSTRRRPLLLDPRTANPISPEDRRGTIVDTSV